MAKVSEEISLLVTAGPLAGHRFDAGAELVLGRENVDVVIPDREMSRRHARIRSVGGHAEIEDLGSLNGTWINGRRIERSTPLAIGDVVKLGVTEIEVESAPVRRELPSVPAAPPEPAIAAAPPVQRRLRSVASRLSSFRPRPKDEDVEPRQPIPAAEPSEPQLAPSKISRLREDELRPVTVLFADIVGSTALGERLSPDEVKALIGECVSRMSHTVEEFGGFLQATMGDGICAYFGVPAAHEDDPERAANAALRILEAVGTYARDIEAEWGIRGFSVRVGINTGQTAVGLVGGADPQPVALGDITNVAARLQSAAAPGTVAVGSVTARALEHHFMLEPLGDLTIKGRDAPVAAWRLAGLRRASQAPMTTPLIGREVELEHLRSELAELAAGRGGILFLVGDPGIGKSRLLNELRRLAGEQMTWIEGHCSSYRYAVYSPFVAAFRAWLGVDADDSDVAVRVKLRAKLTDLVGPRVGEVLPSLARLLSVKVDPEFEESEEDDSAESADARIRKAYRAWIEALARRRPVVLALEDIHWADAGTRTLAEELLEATDRIPLLLTATLRVDRVSEGWRLRVRALADYDDRTDEVRVPPLSEEASLQLLSVLMPGVLDDALRQEIVVRAEGNPLYLEELANMLVAGVEVKRRETWTMTFRAADLLPPALESLLVARIDRLPPSARRLTQIAAVVGRVFPVRVLERVAQSDDLDRDLSVLLRADIIREQRRYPELEYTFKQDLLHGAALSTLNPRRRAELYGRVAGAFEEILAPAVDDHLELLAHYYARSHDRARALEYLERAGVKAAAVQASAQAVLLWKKALKVAARLGDEGGRQRIAARLAELGEEAPAVPRLPEG